MQTGMCQNTAVSEYCSSVMVDVKQKNLSEGGQHRHGMMMVCNVYLPRRLQVSINSGATITPLLE